MSSSIKPIDPAAAAGLNTNKTANETSAGADPPSSEPSFHLSLFISSLAGEAEKAN